MDRKIQHRRKCPFFPKLIYGFNPMAIKTPGLFVVKENLILKIKCKGRGTCQYKVAIFKTVILVNGKTYKINRIEKRPQTNTHKDDQVIFDRFNGGRLVIQQMVLKHHLPQAKKKKTKLKMDHRPKQKT